MIFLRYCQKQEVNQIGKKDVYNFFNYYNKLSDTTKRDYYYAIRILWKLLDRPKDPPYPSTLQRQFGKKKS